MTKVLLIAALLISTSAFATGSNSNGDVTNNNDNRNYGGNTNNAGGAGGNGGQGGAGGVGYGGNASASAGAVAGATAINKNDIKNTNLNANSSKSSSGVKDSGNSVSASGVVGSGNSTSNSGGNKMSNDGNNSNTSVVVEGDKYEAARIPVATAYAAGLAASNGTCLGSASGGMQLPGFGFSAGKTTLDEGCDARYDAQALREAGLPKVAIARLCLKPEIAQAMADAGQSCTSAKPTAPVVSSTTAWNTTPKTAAYNGNDPIIRSRLGLPPLAGK